MPRRNAHLLVSSHISSAFKQPYFYTIPPSVHRDSGSNRSHASSALRERIKDSTSATGANASAADHALHATINTLPVIGDVLLRITHSGYALEATLLDWHDGQPVVWEFTEKLVPMPAITVISRGNEMVERSRLTGDQCAYVYVLLEGGTLYRISFPLHPPFFHDEGWNAKKSRLKEYVLPSNVTRPITGSMLVQKDRSITVNVNKGALLRFDVDDDGTLKDRLYYPHQQSLLSKVFRTVNPEEDQIISLASPASIGGSSNLVFTLSRDRYLRVWDKQEGNIFGARLPSGPGLADKEPEAKGSRASSVISGSNTTGGTPQHLLGRERRNYVRCFYMSQTDHSAKNLRILVFIPTPHTPSSGGFFILYRLSEPANGSKLEALGEKEASDRTAKSALKDFVVKVSDKGAEVHCLWEHSGESMYEFADLGIERAPKQPRPENERHDSGSSDVLMQDSLSEDEEQPPPSIDEEDYDSRFAPDSWQLVTPLRPSTSSSIPSADSVNFLSSLDLTSPNIVSTILQELFRPGGFSPYTIAEALAAYVEASWVRDEKASRKSDALKTRTDPLKDQNTALRVALSRSYPTLRERVGAIVGCRLGPDTRAIGAGNPLNGTSNPMKDSINSLADMPDMTTGQEQEYYAALRRDWEGFLARCREIEKAGRWPVGLGVVGVNKDKNRTTNGDCVVLERERMGMLVGEDSALGVHRRVMNEIEGTESAGLGSVNARWRNDGLHLLVGTSLALKSTLAPSTWADVTAEMYQVIRQSIGMTYQDLLLDLGKKVVIDDMSDDIVQWVFDQVELIGDEIAFARALDSLGVLVRNSTAAEEAAIVKLEEDEEEVGMMLLHPSSSFNLPALGRGVSVGPSGVYADHHNQWTRSLTASYLSSSLEARYDMSSSVVFLMMLLKSRRHDWMEVTSAVVVDELFAGLRSSSLLRQCASRVMEDDKSGAGPGPIANGNNAKERPGALKGRATHLRAGTADSVVAHLANMNVGASMRAPAVHFSNSPARVVFAPHMPISLAAFPTLPPTTRGSGSVPLLQSLLPPLRRPFKLPYASDAFLLSNGIIHSDSMLIACADEVRFAEDLRGRGHLAAAADVIDWLPKGNACCYVAGRLRTQRGDYDEAADLFERSGRSFGSLAFRNETEAQALRAVLPKHLEDLDSLSGYYEHIAKLFEEESQYQLAVPFYKLAIESVEDPRMSTDLWYNVFRGQLFTDEYEAAYMSLMAMTDPELRRKLVSELVTTMCDRNHVEMLMRFNFVGCANEVEAALGFKARNADPLQRPLYSQIMYSWYIKRGDYRNAASTMYQRARILEQQATDDVDLRFRLISLQVEAYIVAINALCLLDDRDAWISLPLPDEDQPQGDGYGPGGFGRFGALPESKFGEANRDSEIVELADMRRECELCSSRRRLIIIKLVIENRITEEDFLISPMEVLQRYSELGMFEEALYAARIFQEDMTVIFTQLVGTCVRLSRGDMLGDHEKGWVMSETIVRWEGGWVQKAWRLLQHSLERHDSAHNGWQYRKVCLERILDADRVTAPPTWLTAFFQDREPEYLIRTCLRYHMILAAIDYTMLMIQKANQMFDKGSTVAATQTHLPYALIDSVVGSATTGEEKRRAELVRAEVNSRVGKVGRWDWS